ncbi:MULTISPECIES: class I SAM-dependent methyltransferase [Halocynthiibacter]|uniref:Class I SAM-dependent methyltransferase n=1 Tax=Halocynthiibacter halioticoli TaxID=2986804 RepID=A0AAE3IZX1_9RHOB|nr:MULTISPECIES: class I SAM-dependent methyltransferase [Halocynthiibacter]MCV6824779.1 class I SAM-dependent methyltransferase [Halocynthiibacter halioticoli]MCW4057780.1 class I SAM-dependent methyltransferase [Halocynthiibacter sp. SDUM655004]
MLMLGRQGLHVNRPRLRRAANRLLDEFQPELTIEELEQEDGFAEPLFEALGVQRVQSLDYSQFEGASFAHDLNTPIPSELVGKFDIVLDGGTLEHVFDVKTAMTNAFDLLAPGGTFIAASPGNNWFAHGFYQFGPELVFSFWKRTKGCEVLQCTFLPEFPRDAPFEIEDPYETKRRLRMAKKLVPQRCYLFYVVRKPLEASDVSETPLQGDYTHRWSEAGSGGDGA